MSDPIPNASPIVAQTAEDQRIAREQAVMLKILADHDRARASSPKVSLICTTPFTVKTDDHPDGFIVNRGDFFEVAQMDVSKHIGRGQLPGPAMDRLPPVISF